jgi:hypothetical protein
MFALGVFWFSVAAVPGTCESTFENEVLVVKGVLVIAESVLENGTALVETAVSDIRNVSALCAVARLESKRKRRLNLRIIVKDMYH